MNSITVNSETPMSLAIKRDSTKCVEVLCANGLMIEDCDVRLALEVRECCRKNE